MPTISSLTNASTLTGAETFPMVQSGATRKSTIARLFSEYPSFQVGPTGVARTAYDKWWEATSVKDFGARGDGATDDTAAIQAAITYFGTGGGRLHFPAGNYKISGAINLTGVNNLHIFGDGVDNTLITTTSATADVFYDGGTSWWRTIEDMTITSSVTKTAGSFFNFTTDKRGMYRRLKMTNHIYGITFPAFEQTQIDCVSITTPTGAGNAITAGTAGVSGAGANLLITNCFIRGNNDITQNAPTGNYGLYILDCDAIWMENTDIGAFVQYDMLIIPSVRGANHFFLQCFFDATKNADCVNMQGAGTKQQITFTGCWFASAGKMTGGNAEACGVRMQNSGTYQDIQFTGCKFYNCSGSGLLMEMPGCDVNINGNDFYANGTLAATNRYGLFWSPASAATVGPCITGNKFGGANAPNDLRFGTNSAKHSVNGNNLSTGVSDASTGGRYAGNYDPTAGDVASATAVVGVQPTHIGYVNVTGNGNIGGINATFKGHILSFKLNAALNLVDNFAGGNLRLAGNFAAVANSQITLVCDGTDWLEIARSNN